MMFEHSPPDRPVRTARVWRALLATAISFCFAVFGAAAALAQSPQGDYQSSYQGDPPGRVARLSDLTGQVWLLTANSNEWVSAARNQPLTTGDRIATESGVRAELQIGSSTVRLDGGTELEMARLDDDHLSLFLHSGSAAAHLWSAEDVGEFDLSTNDGRFRALRTGRYRFDLKDNASHLTVYEGQAVYEGQNSALTVNAGQHAEFWIDQNNTAQYAMSGPYNDAFAAWINERDRAVASYRQGPAMQYISPEMTGAEDLDRYGTWEQSPDYGALWVPTVVAVDWAPYRVGHWVWVVPWGWTWIDDAPWGFAPFHYGRWVRFHDRWCWAPGQRVVRPVYAPALVAWVGGPNFSVSVRIGDSPGPAVGWFPLAPREVYLPSYRASPRYVQNVNITHVTNVTVINNVYRNPQAPRDFANRRFPGAVTVVPASAVASRQPIAPIASKWRDAPGVREIATRATQPVVVAPPVAAPAVAQRPADRSAIKPPPGFPAARPGGGRPAEQGTPAMGRGREPADTSKPSAAAPSVAAPNAPQPGQRPGRPETAQRPERTPNGNAGVAAPGVTAPNTPPPPPGQANRPERPDRPGGPPERDERREGGARPGSPAVTPAPAQPAPSPQPQAAPQRTIPPIPQGTIPQGHVPNAAIPGQPPQRGGGNEGPRDGIPPRPDRPDRPERIERPAPPHTAPQPAPQAVQRAPEPPRPVMQAPQRPVEVPRPSPPAEVRRPAPAEVQRPAPAEVQRPAPQAEVHRPAPPEVRRPEPPQQRQREEQQRGGDPRERGGKREQQ